MPDDAQWPSVDCHGLPLTDPVGVVHQGTVLVFAREAGQPVTVLYYNERIPGSGPQDGTAEWAGWNKLDMTEPSQAAGRGVASADAEPLLRVAGMDLVTVPPAATAPSPADAAFQVVSDGQYVCCVRPSTAGTLYVDRFLLVESPPPAHDRQTAAVATRHELERPWEVRYRRSGRRDVRDGDSDTLDYRDMLDRPFLEPTIELAGVEGAGSAHLSVLLAPTSGAAKRWHIFTVDGGRLHAVSFPSDDSGRPDPAPGTASRFDVAPAVQAAGGASLPLTCTAGAGAVVYEEQEPSASGDGGPSSLRRATRIMVAVPVAGDALPGGLAVYDFQVRPDGTIPALPAGAPCVPVDGTMASGSFAPQPAAAYPVPDSAVRVVGDATVHAVLLGVPRASAAPFLLDGADGLVHCYFAGAPEGAGPGPQLVAQYKPQVTRATVHVPWAAASQSGALAFIAQRSGSSFDGLAITVADCAGAPDLCDLTVDYGAAAGVAAEVWKGVPRELGAMTAILGGAGSGASADPDVRSGLVPYYDYGGGMPMARLAVDGGAGYLTFLSRRPDVPLASVALAGNELRLGFTAGATAVTQTWSGVPLDTGSLVPIMRGGVSPGIYSYTPASADAAVYGIPTEAGTILLFAAAGAAVTIEVADAGHPARCNVVVTAAGATHRLKHVPRAQDGFVARLAADPDLSSLFVHVSPDPLAGDVADGTAARPLDLRGVAILLDVVAPPAGGTLVAADVPAAVLQGVEPARGALQALGAVPVSVPSLGQAATVGNGSFAVDAPGQNGAWVAAAAPQALDFAGLGVVSVPLTGANASRLAPGRTWTVEAWAAASGGGEARLVTYGNGPAAVLGGVVPSYFLGTTGSPSLEFQPYAPTYPFDSAYVNIPADPAFNLAGAQALTWEAWVKPAAPPPAGLVGCVLQGQDTVFPGRPQFQLSLDEALLLTFSWRGGALTAGATLEEGAWSHVAVTGARGAGGWTFTLYVDAVAVGQVAGAQVEATSLAPFACIGAHDPRNISLFGSVAEVRLWSAARTPAELARTMSVSLSGTEFGLVGYWPLDGDPSQAVVNACQATGPALDGRLQPNAQGVASSVDGAFLGVVAGVGGSAPILGRAFMRAGRWNHVAVTYEAGTALALDPGGGLDATPLPYGSCASPTGLAVGDQATFEAWVQLAPPAGPPETIFSRWGHGPGDQSYRFGIAADGTPFCSVTVQDRMSGTSTVLTVPSPGTAVPSVADRAPHHLAVTYAAGTAGDSGGLLTTSTLVLYVDGVKQATTTQTFATPSLAVVDSSAPFCVGLSAPAGRGDAAVAIEAQAPFRGILTGVRFWSTALRADQVQAAMTQLDAYDAQGGVVSAWWFTEQADVTARDPVGGNDLALNATGLWAAFASMSATTCYANGIPIGQPASAPPQDAAAYQGFTVGGLAPAGTVLDGLAGPLAELRVWDTARSADELVDTMYHPLRGDEPGLVGYWSFDGDAVDRTGGGNDGVPGGAASPRFIPSTAPVGNEGPAVRNVYGGPVTDFQAPLTGTPSVIEYGDTEVGPDATHMALMRRGYVYTNPSLVLATGYGMGELDLVYLGEVQTNPTLIGYVEGAPPVPSENLGRQAGADGYVDATTVTLRQDAATTLSFSSSDYRTSITMDLDAKVGVFITSTLNVGTPFFSTDEFTGKIKLGAHHKSNLVEAAQTDQRYTSAWTETLTDTVGLRGTWEPGPPYLNAQVGRRWVPWNLGYALVESMTADLYSMRFRSTGAMVGKIAIPNLAIPPDRNIIHFKIDPKYVKNGTLDGKVGLANDSDYDKADVERGSYFQPAEAYRLKADIERQELALQAYFDQLQPASRVGAGGTSLGDAAQRQLYDFGAQVARKSIANEYVWTAYGGLHAEEEQYSAAHDRTYSGFYSYTNATGLIASADWAFKIGVFGGLDLLFGGTVRFQAAKEETDARTLGLSATVACDPTLVAWDPGDGVDGADGGATVPCPGKVDGYRFMTFYLSPATANADAFPKVVDHEWLQLSSDPNAIALRGAQVAGNEVWRILHRVTYVSRIPPQSDSTPAQTVAPTHRGTIAVGDNPWLLALVLAELGAGPVTPAGIGAAVAAVLAPADGTPARLSAVIPWWEAFLASARDAKSDPAAATVLQQLLTGTAGYVETGFSSGALEAGRS